MIERILKAKHWQLFIFMVGIPFITQLIFMGIMVSKFFKMAMDGTPDPTLMFESFEFFPLIGASVYLILFGWYWSVAVGLHHKIPKGINLKLKRFKIIFFVLIIYLCLFSVFMALIFTAMEDFTLKPEGFLPDFHLLGIIIPIFFLLHLSAIAGMFYLYIFVARTINIVELQKDVKILDCMGEFALVWFFPIGIWMLQPRINKLIDAEASSL